jgi:hypothetical protein
LNDHQASLDSSDSCTTDVSAVTKSLDTGADPHVTSSPSSGMTRASWRGLWPVETLVDAHILPSLRTDRPPGDEGSNEPAVRGRDPPLPFFIGTDSRSTDLNAVVSAGVSDFDATAFAVPGLLPVLEGRGGGGRPIVVGTLRNSSRDISRDRRGSSIRRLRCSESDSGVEGTLGYKRCTESVADSAALVLLTMSLTELTGPMPG